MSDSLSSLSFYFQLQKELENLPGEDAHIEMFPQRTKSSDAIKLQKEYRISAVAALLYFDGITHQIFLIERQEYDGKHSGQIGFPGGKMEAVDDNEQAAALRETYEEIGIDPTQINIIGKLSNVYIPVSNFLVFPFIGHLNELPKFQLDSREVKTIFSFSLSELLKSENKIITDVNVGEGNTFKNVPAFFINEKIIWGATALMLNELKVILTRLNY